MSIAFEPYVGPRFAQSPVRLLILGESHYGEPNAEDPHGATRKVVHMWRTRQWAVRYLTIAARIVTGLKAWEIDRDTAFAEIAFYNFVQVQMPTIKHRPTAEQCRASWDAFREVLELHDPTHILTTGSGLLWSNMPASDGRSDEMTLATEPLALVEYRTPSGFALATVIPHLSRASAPRWHGPVRAFLALTQEVPMVERSA